MKTLRQLFSKFEPERDCGFFLDSIGENYRVKKSREDPNRFEIEIHPAEVLAKPLIYKTEEAIRDAYEGMYLVRFDTVYKPEMFGFDCIKGILEETERRGGVARGFFSGCEYSLKAGELTVSISFGNGAIDFLNLGKTEQLISQIIAHEFSVNLNVHIRKNEAAQGYFQSEEYRNFKSALDEQCRTSLANYEKRQAQQGKDGEEDAAAAAPALNLTRKWSPYDEDCEAATEGTKCTIGGVVFDLSEPEYFFGKEFPIEPESISLVRTTRSNVTVVGTVVNVKSEERMKGKWSFTFGLFDGNATILVRFPQGSEDDVKELGTQFFGGMVLAANGDVSRDKKSGDPVLNPKSFAKISRSVRKDKAEQKRVELHLHTTMSAMDALIAPDAAVKTAMKWGHKAVAITDHGNVQGFPDAMLALEKIYKGSDVPKEERFKILYGMEAYFVNNTASPLYGKYTGTFENEMVVFDLETTGLSAASCKIIEIGAVKVRGGEIVDRYSTFVNPGCPISEETTNLTSITDADVSGAPTIAEALPEFLSFIGDDLLIAHNADFDTGFVRAAAQEMGLEFSNPYLDTVGLSRFLNTELKSHKLDVVAKYFGLGDFNHHRAVDDAEMLTNIFFAMVEKMKKFDIKSFEAMTNEIRNNADPLKLKSYHMVILVKNLTGLKNLYRLISSSYLKYYHRNPRIPRTELEKYREGLIIGSACSAGELYEAILENKSQSEIEDIASFYDYLEVQPITNDMYLIEENKVQDAEALRNINRKIVALGEKLGKPVCATSDAHFINPEDELYRHILLAGMKFKDADKSTPIYLHTTEEMLEEFAYLGEEKAFEIVVTNTNMIADMVERIRPIPEGNFPPHIDGADEELSEKCWTRARNMYGDDLPELVSSRLNTELTSIIKNGYAVLYVIAERLVHYSESQGYLVGSRGSVGSSFVATMAGISEVNPLPPHYYCKKCRYSDFSNKHNVGSGFDMPTEHCPRCGEKLEQDGQDIPFETFLGFKGDKSPDIDLNFSGEVQGKVHKFTEELFGEGNVFKAGTLGTLADKTAYGFVMKYYESKGIQLSRAESDRIIDCCVGVKRTTGQHPGGIIVVPREYEVYDFTPVQHPADDPKSDIVTTHFAFSYLHDTILKLDELGHDIPTKYKFLEKYSGVSVMDVQMNDRSVYEIFESTDPLGIPQMDREDHRTRMLGLSVGTLGLPEFGTNFIQQVLIDAKPKNFADLMQISGLTHGTDVWLGNAQDLIKNGICDISQVVGTRDGIMLDLIRYGVEKSLSFKIMEFVRKNKKGIKIPPEMIDAMKEKNVPDWYMDSLQKIKYMFPKAHAAAYVMSAIRLAWYKVHQPVAFYCAILTVAPDGFDGSIVARGREAMLDKMTEIDNLGKDASATEKDTLGALAFANEAMMRGIRFLPANLKYSAAKEFLPENGAIRMPLIALPGLGEGVALNIVAARDEEPFFSVDDLKERGKANTRVIDILRENDALGGLSETDQISMFDMI